MTGLAAVCAGSLHGNGGLYLGLQCGFSYLCCPVHRVPYNPQLSAVFWFYIFVFLVLDVLATYFWTSK